MTKISLGVAVQMAELSGNTSVHHHHNPMAYILKHCSFITTVLKGHKDNQLGFQRCFLLVMMLNTQ